MHKPVCRSCGYDLAGLPGLDRPDLICPECGTALPARRFPGSHIERVAALTFAYSLPVPVVVVVATWVIYRGHLWLGGFWPSPLYVAPFMLVSAGVTAASLRSRLPRAGFRTFAWCFLLALMMQLAIGFSFGYAVFLLDVSFLPEYDAPT